MRVDKGVMEEGVSRVEAKSLSVCLDEVDDCSGTNLCRLCTPDMHHVANVSGCLCLIHLQHGHRTMPVANANHRDPARHRLDQAEVLLQGPRALLDRNLAYRRHKHRSTSPLLRDTNISTLCSITSGRYKSSIWELLRMPAYAPGSTTPHALDRIVWVPPIRSSVSATLTIPASTSLLLLLITLRPLFHILLNVHLHLVLMRPWMRRLEALSSIRTRVLLDRCVLLCTGSSDCRQRLLPI
mmetsp:Transcript_17152/g.43344  ORF Transcript_17152/g.43344 Transcript_17152/m.43344 type:complete len:240 (+) Transcript_17152:831-1550(+)